MKSERNPGMHPGHRAKPDAAPNAGLAVFRKHQSITKTALAKTAVARLPTAIRDEAAAALPVLQSWAPRNSPDVHASQPRPRVLCYTSLVPNHPHRYYGAGYLHFITTSCYRRLPLLQKPQHRDLLLEVLEQVRRRYRFVVVGYVIMPEHLHLLLSEPERGDPSKLMQAIKQGFARRLRGAWRTARLAANDPRQGSLWEAVLERGHIWQARFYDFVVFTEKKRVEKLRYMHRNPVKRGLVPEPQQWAWSSYRHYADGERGPVLVNEAQKAELNGAELKIRKIA